MYDYDDDSPKREHTIYAAIDELVAELQLSHATEDRLTTQVNQLGRELGMIAQTLGVPANYNAVEAAIVKLKSASVIPKGTAIYASTLTTDELVGLRKLLARAGL